MVPWHKPALNIQLLQTVMPFTDLTEAKAIWGHHCSGITAAPSLWQTMRDWDHTQVQSFLNPYAQQ